MKILIVAPKYEKYVGIWYAFPIGLASISSALKNGGHQVECLNSNHYFESMDMLLTERLASGEFDVICTGGISPLFYKIGEILTIAKKAAPGLITIIGGGLVSCEPELVLDMLPADIGVVGEGDQTVVELMGALEGGRSLDGVRGIVYRDRKGGIRLTPPRPSIKDIDALPFPDYDGLELAKFLDMLFQNETEAFNLFDDPRVVPIVGSRSCPYQCTFCFHPLGNTYRQHSLNYLFQEIEFLIDKYRANGLHIYDELFSTAASNDRLVEFCDRIKDYRIQWAAQLRVDGVDKALLEHCKEAGCIHISYGLESASNKILKSMRKHISVEQIESALDQTYETGIAIRGNFIFGDKEETLDTVQETMEWWARHYKYQISLSYLQPYPGTALYHYGLSEGIIPDKRQFMKVTYPVINLTKMSDEEWDYVREETAFLMYYHAVIPATIVSCARTGFNDLKGPIYALEIICPHCGSTSVYPNMNHTANAESRAYYNLYCRHCLQKFNVFAFNIEARMKEIVSIIGNEDAALCWYDDRDIELLFKMGTTLTGSISHVLEIGDPVSEKYVKNRQVVTFGHHDNMKRDLKYVVYPIARFKDEYLDQIQQMEDEGLMVLRLYVFKNLSNAVEVINGLRARGNYEEAREALREARDQFPVEVGLEHLDLTVSFESKDIDSGEAKKKLRHIISRWPADWTAYDNLAVIKCNDGDPQQALQLLNRAVRLSPGNSIVEGHIRECREALRISESQMSPATEGQEGERASELLLRHIKRPEDENEKCRTKISRISKLIGKPNGNGHSSKAHRNLIVTGMPGTGLESFIHILNVLDNAACFEGASEDITSLPDMFSYIRKILLEDPEIICRNNGRNNIMSEGSSIPNGLSGAPRRFDEDVVVGLNLNISYFVLNEMQELKQNELKTLINVFGYRIIAIMADPVTTIAEWNSENFQLLPEGMITEENLSPRWAGMKFGSTDRFERQAQIWDFYARTFWNLRDIIKIYTVDQLITHFERVLGNLCNFLSLNVPDNMDPPSRFLSQPIGSDVARIKEAIEKYCPSRHSFGFDTYERDRIPGIWDEPVIFCRTVPKIG
ncbi:MAG: radical SAM protein [Deltaproteobacteria bacterium]|nr:radical SAM protein [Deltaproteobacteria bacterium]